VLSEVAELRKARMSITSNIADQVNSAKTFIIKAEDARAMDSIKYMRKYYSDAMGVNATLFLELEKRRENSERLMVLLKAINSMISCAGNLRMGRFKAEVVNECRTCIKSNNF